MSGHSKWHNIQAKKGKADAARGKIFTKLGREILIAVKAGGPDPAGNSKLKDVIAKCKAANMPNDTINNAIKKASGSNESYEEITTPLEAKYSHRPKRNRHTVRAKFALQNSQYL